MLQNWQMIDTINFVSDLPALFFQSVAGIILMGCVQYQTFIPQLNTVDESFQGIVCWLTRTGLFKYFLEQTCLVLLFNYLILYAYVITWRGVTFPPHSIINSVLHSSSLLYYKYIFLSLQSSNFTSHFFIFSLKSCSFISYTHTISFSFCSEKNTTK